MAFKVSWQEKLGEPIDLVGGEWRSFETMALDFIIRDGNIRGLVMDSLDFEKGEDLTFDNINQLTIRII